MKRKLVKILVVLFIAIFSIQLKVQAAVITSTDKQVETNSGSVTISVTSKTALGSFALKLTDTAGLTLENTTKGSSSFEVSSDQKTITGSSSDGITNLGSFTFKVPTVTSDTTYKIKFSVSGMETTNLETIADESNTAVITVKAPAVEEPQEPTTPTTPTTPTEPTNPPVETPQPSSEARLKMLGIRPNDFSGFKQNKYEYTAEVPNNVTEVEIYADKGHAGQTINGAGEVELKEGSNVFEVQVTAEDAKTTKTYKLTIKRRTANEENEKQSEARLNNLGIKPEEYDFEGFDKDKTEYSVEIPSNVEEIEIYATAVNSSSQITGIGMITLEEGDNTLTIEVISENGTKKTYTIEVKRTGATENDDKTEEKFGLSTLSVVGATLKPKFDEEIYEYTLDLKEDVSSLELVADVANENITVEIIGNENLQEGENVITIMVKNTETQEVVTYQIMVNKSLIREEIVTSWLKPSTWGKEEKIKLAIIVGLIILIIIAVILKMKISKENNRVTQMDFPGREELDKAIAEHQELVEEPEFEINVPKGEIETNYIEEENINVIPKRKGRHF